MEMLSFHRLEETIREYFADYFNNMSFVPEDENCLMMTAKRGSMQIGHNFWLPEWQGYFNDNTQMHQLENIKGCWVRSEQEIILENKKSR